MHGCLGERCHDRAPDPCQDGRRPRARWCDNQSTLAERKRRRQFQRTGRAIAASELERYVTPRERGQLLGHGAFGSSPIQTYGESWSLARAGEESQLSPTGRSALPWRMPARVTRSSSSGVTSTWSISSLAPS